MLTALHLDLHCFLVLRSDLSELPQRYSAEAVSPFAPTFQLRLRPTKLFSAVSFFSTLAMASSSSTVHLSRPTSLPNLSTNKTLLTCNSARYRAISSACSA